MWYNIIIMLPILGIALDSFDLLFTPFGRILVIAALILGLVAALRRPSLKLQPQFLRSALASLGGALATFALSTELGLGPVVASGLVGLIGAQVLKGREQTVMYLGAFVGMSSVLRFPTYTPLIIAGLLGGLFFELLDESWVGVGGRLGTLAASAVVVVLVLLGGA